MRAELTGFGMEAFGAPAALAALLVLLLVGLLAAQRRAARRGEAAAQSAEARLAEMIRTQSELQGRVQAMTEVLGSRQVELARAVSERLDAMTRHLGDNLEHTGRRTGENLAKLNERLAVIDAAQKHIHDLAGEISGLQRILANKQSRGAFGQSQMEAIVADGLPRGTYAFQPTLSNGKRPDCVIRLPGHDSVLVVDAKFPLEAYTALRAAETADARRAAAAQFRQNMARHVSDIAERYFIPGETHDTALMFVPSESVYAELHESFDDVIQRAYRARVVIVSPSLLVLSIQVMQSILKDARMREQAGVIQREVACLGDDVRRLQERVLNLQRHFGQARSDMDEIVTSAEKISRRSARIEALDVEEGDAPMPALLAGE